MSWSSFPNILPSHGHKPKPEDDHRWAMLVVHCEDRRYKHWVSAGDDPLELDRPCWMPEQEAREVARSVRDCQYYDLVFIIHAEEISQ